MKRFLLLSLCWMSACCLCLRAQSVADSPGAVPNGFVTTEGTHFLCDGKPYYYIGTNFWYGPILASEGSGGNRDRLARELDMLKSIGIGNLRILVGADGGSRYANTVEPYLQSSPGVYNDTLLAGLDFLLMEMDKRGMKAVLYLTNSWDWSGGFGFYLRATGHGDSPNAADEGYNRYVDYAATFAKDTQAQALYLDHVRAIVSRTNRYTRRPYKEDPAIMAWQICNEPRPFSRENKAEFAGWVGRTAALIKQIDPNHLVSTGSEGLYGCETDTALCATVHSDKHIDYLTAHVWPANWGWAAKDKLAESMPNVLSRTKRYIDLHESMAHSLQKPLVVEEFGYPRDGYSFSPTASTDSRDKLYSYIFGRVRESRAKQGALAGCNFWGWGGSGRPAGETWHPGHDYLCDPPHEPQGWYSVFDCDASTLRLTRQATSALQ